MSYQSDIYDAVIASTSLAALIGDRFAWDIADGTTATPYIVAQTISADGETDHDGTRTWSFPLIQFSCWAATKAQAIAVMAAFRAALEGVTLPGTSHVSLSYSGEQSSRDPETRLFGELMDYRASTLTN